MSRCQAVGGEEKFDVKISEYGDGVTVRRVADPQVACAISLTSPAMKIEAPFDRMSITCSLPSHFHSSLLVWCELCSQDLLILDASPIHLPQNSPF